MRGIATFDTNVPNVPICQKQLNLNANKNIFLTLINPKSSELLSNNGPRTRNHASCSQFTTFICSAIFYYEVKNPSNDVKFIYSEKATKFCEISPVDLPYVTSVSKKPGQTIVLYHYCGLSRFFLKQTLVSFQCMNEILKE